MNKATKKIACDSAKGKPKKKKQPGKRMCCMVHEKFNHITKIALSFTASRFRD
jgi:hypothetical protein